MPTGAPPEAYGRMIAYGDNKARLKHDKLALQSFMAGLWVALYGHCCTYFAAYFHIPDQPYSAGISKGVYGCLFPGAFVAVSFSGSELFTGNTVTMIMNVLNADKTPRFKKLQALARVWLFSFVGNAGGAIFGAFLISWCSRAFDGPQQYDFLARMASGKVFRDWGANLVLAIGCNMLVCLATWCTISLDDSAGKILAMFYTVGAFAVGGFEHIIANFYTLSAALFYGVPGLNVGNVLVRNLIPVFLGNLLAGTVFTGVTWWYAMHPSWSDGDLSPVANDPLVKELVKRMGTNSHYGTASVDDQTVPLGGVSIAEPQNYGTIRTSKTSTSPLLL